MLAHLLRGNYPFKKLWSAGVGTFAVGILFPAVYINQFFNALLIMPGILMGLFFAWFLNERAGKMELFSSITLVFLIYQVFFIITIVFDNEWSRWLFENMNPYSATILMNAIMDMIIGVSVGIRVILVLRHLDGEAAE